MSTNANDKVRKIQLRREVDGTWVYIILQHEKQPTWL